MKNRSLRWTILLAVVATLLPGAACRKADAPTEQQELIVSAAVSLKDAFNEIAQISETRNKVKVRFNFGASGALQKQIEAGAPADIFASAGAKQMDELAAKNLIVATSRSDFARNVLVLIQPSKATQSISSFNDLTKAEIKKIAVGNPKTVPAGQYTEQTFNKLRLLPGIQAKLIYAEDVRQVLDYVARGEVDAGCVYSSDVATAGGKVKEVTRAPDDSHDPIVYPIALIKDGHNQAAAQKFVDLVLSPEGQSILAKHGFVAVGRR